MGNKKYKIRERTEMKDYHSKREDSSDEVPNYCSLRSKEVLLSSLDPYRFFKKSFGADIDEKDRSIFTELGIKDTSAIKKIAPGATVLYEEKENIENVSKYYYQDLRHDILKFGSLTQRAVDVCDSNVPNLFLDYNCIAYALGYVEWIQPTTLKLKKTTSKSTIAKVFEKMAKNATVEFSGCKSKKFTAYTVEEYSNLKKLSYGDIALYFEDGINTHTAIYGVDNKAGTTFDCWNSKMGAYPVFCHELSDIFDSYGEVEYYLKCQDTQHEIKEDL